MTRLFLAAGVAALAIAMPASAKPGGEKGGQAAAQSKQGGGKAQARAGGRSGKAARVQSRGRGGDRQAVRVQSRGGGKAQARNVERRGGSFSTRHAERRVALQDRGRGHDRSAVRMERGNNKAKAQRTQRFEQREVRKVEHQRGNRFEQVRNREVREFRGNRQEQLRNREAFRDGRRFERFEDRREAFRDAFRGDRIRVREFDVKGRRFALGGCPPGLVAKGCIPPGQRAKFLGQRLSNVERISTLSAVPLSVRYLYPDTNDFYYRYGDGFMYRVDRDDALISALLPLAFGGYMPGSYFPSSFMNNSYYGVPNYYGFNSFYPDSRYDCNRFVNGVIYQVDCFSGMVEDVIPLYASGYGVGQMLPVGYGYYNVPNQYRSMYYNTPDYNYWYAPGAIYQYDPTSSLITSVAALLSPGGFSIGQPMPLGYNAYNVPYGYRSTYYDTPNSWYRYNNGYIYQVDPTTQLVTAIVASILT